MSDILKNAKLVDSAEDDPINKQFIEAMDQTPRSRTIPWTPKNRSSEPSEPGMSSVIVPLINIVSDSAQSPLLPKTHHTIGDARVLSKPFVPNHTYDLISATTVDELAAYIDPSDSVEVEAVGSVFVEHEGEIEEVVVNEPFAPIAEGNYRERVVNFVVPSKHTFHRLMVQVNLETANMQAFIAGDTTISRVVGYTITGRRIGYSQAPAPVEPA